MKLTRIAIGFSFFCVSLAYANNPNLPSGTLPSSGAGVDINVALTTWEGVTTGGGGEFGGSVTSPYNGKTVLTNFWCVDYQEAFEFGQSSIANMTTLNAIPSVPSEVRYSNVGNTGSPAWLNTTTNGTTGGSALPSDAQARYEMAAYLVMQYNASDAAGPSNYDDAIQDAIWAITDNSGTGGIYSSGGIYELGNQNLNSSVTPNGIPSNLAGTGVDQVGYWVQQALNNYTLINTSDWAVVSWGALPNGTLGTGPWYDADTNTTDPTQDGARQTFLVELDTGTPINSTNPQTPEPGFYGVLALGLGGLFVGISRRKKA